MTRQAKRRPSRRVAGAITCAAAAVATATRAGADVIYGVQAAAFDQPFIHMLLTPPGSTTELTYDTGDGGTGYDVQAYLDTGASGIVLSYETYTAFEFDPAVYNGRQVAYYDTGVAGGQGFAVSPTFGVRTANYLGFANDVNYADPPPVADFTQTVPGAHRAQLITDPTNPDDPLDPGPLDIAGTPVMAGKVVVVDPKPLNEFLLSAFESGDKLHSYIYAPGTPFNAATADTDPGIPTVNHHVRLSTANFARFTETDPAGAPTPSITGNPIIGPDPVKKLDGVTGDTTPPVVVQLGTRITAGSFLLDTGAQASFISTTIAAALGVHYQPGSQDAGNPVLVDANGTVLPNQFQVAVGGIGGAVTSAGFFLDSLSLPSTEGDALTFSGAPVLVTDVTVTDPVTGQSLTLDGDIGINYFVASTSTDLNASALGAFDWMTYDQPNGILGLQLPVDPDAKPVAAGATFHYVANGSGGILARTVPGLTLAPGATVVVDAAANRANRQVIVVTGAGLTLGGVPGAWTSKVDVGNNDLVLAGENLAVVTSMAAQGFAGGKWNGSGGITSSTAAADAKHLTAVGVIANLAADGESPLYASFDGQPVAAGDILVKVTWYGDANLDGTVTAADYTRLDVGAVGHLSGWANGDFNYDGVINGTDYALIDNAYNHQTASLAAIATPAGLPATAVPEPAGLGGLAAAGLLARRRRQR